MKELTCIWLDDFRVPDKAFNVCYNIIWLKNYSDFCNYINTNGIPDHIAFDHDLGEEKTGYDCAKYLVNYCASHNIDIPTFSIQSSNPVGRDNIKQLLNRYHQVFNIEN